MFCCSLHDVTMVYLIGKLERARGSFAFSCLGLTQSLELTLSGNLVLSELYSSMMLWKYETALKSDDVAKQTKSEYSLKDGVNIKSQPSIKIVLQDIFYNSCTTHWLISFSDLSLKTLFLWNNIMVGTFTETELTSSIRSFLLKSSVMDFWAL